MDPIARYRQIIRNLIETQASRRGRDGGSMPLPNHTDRPPHLRFRAYRVRPAVVSQ